MRVRRLAPSEAKVAHCLVYYGTDQETLLEQNRGAFVKLKKCVEKEIYCLHYER